MKMVILMYLEDDEACVTRLLAEEGVEAFNRLSIEGFAPGSQRGWYGEVAPYESQMILSLLPDEAAASLMEAVSSCRGVEDPRHPIRAVQLAVEQTAACRWDQPSGEGQQMRGS